MNLPSIAPPLAGRTLGSINNDFVVAEWRDPGGPPGPPRLIAPVHHHRSDDEAWYILEGILHMKLGDQIVAAQAGSGVLVPKGTPHTYWNPSANPTRYLLIMTSNIYRLIQALHPMPDRSSPRLRAAFQNFDSELLKS